MSRPWPSPIATRSLVAPPEHAPPGRAYFAPISDSTIPPFQNCPSTAKAHRRVGIVKSCDLPRFDGSADAVDVSAIVSVVTACGDRDV